MNRTRSAPLVASVVLFVAGLVLGSGRSEDDTSTANTASKILLTVGLVAFVVALTVLAVRYLRSRRAAN